MAQQEKVSLSGGELGVEKIIELIQDQTDYLFAFDGLVFDTERTVQPGKTVMSVGELANLITKGTDSSWLVSGSYIVIYPAPRKAPPAKVPTPSRTEDVYSPSDPSADAFGSRAPKLSEPVVPSVPISRIEPVGPSPAPYSVWRAPDIYTPIRHALPQGAVKVDLLYGLTTFTPNIGLEVGLSPHSTLEFTWGWNQLNHNGTKNGNKKLNHGLGRLEYRWWLCERYNGHFFGGHLFGAKYNIGGYEVPTLFKREFRYEGWAFGAGLTYGYHLALTRRLGIDFHIGVGVAHMKQTRFECPRCGTEIDRKSQLWFGPTRAGIDLVFLLWK